MKELIIVLGVVFLFVVTHKDKEVEKVVHQIEQPSETIVEPVVKTTKSRLKFKEGIYCPPVNQDSLIFYFSQFLNDYRTSNGLEPVKVEESLKDFSYQWSAEMARRMDVTHGENETSLKNRIRLNLTTLIPPQHYIGENCTRIWFNKRQKGLTQKDLALRPFQNFQYSPPHNELLLDSRIKYFYITNVHGKDGKTYMEFISTSVMY